MKFDILTIDDLPAEIGIGVAMLRRRKERAARIDYSHLKVANATLQQQLHAVAGYPVRLALPAPEVM